MLFWADLIHRHELVKNSIPPNTKSILDLGGFSTGVHENIKSQFNTEAAFSVNHEYSQGGETPNILGDISSRHFKNDSFDVVTLIDVIEHIKPDKRNIVLELAAGYARRAVILTFPFTSEANISAEQSLLENRINSAHRAWNSFMEHESFGLPNLESVIKFLMRFGEVGYSYHTKRTILFEGIQNQLITDDVYKKQELANDMNQVLSISDKSACERTAYRVKVVVKVND